MNKDDRLSTSFKSWSKSSPRVSVSDIVSSFDSARLTQARRLAAMTKRELADRIGVSAAAVGQYESGAHPRPEILLLISSQLGYPVEYFRVGRPHAQLDASSAHFRSLRKTKSYQRAKAIAFTEQVWEITYALEKSVQLPWVDLPGFSGGEVAAGMQLPDDPSEAARALRTIWGLGSGPIPHLVRTLENRGIVVVIAPPSDGDFSTVDAFSCSRLPRPIVVVSRERANDIYRHRFSVAHELGHLVLHGEAIPGDAAQERAANTFAAEFLTPKKTIRPNLPSRLNFTTLAELQRIWGVSPESLIFRCRETGNFSEAVATRAYQKLNILKSEGKFSPEPIVGFPGEQPVLLRKAFQVASEHGETVSTLSESLAWPEKRVREVLGEIDERPSLRLLNGGGSDFSSSSTNTRRTYDRNARKTRRYSR